MRTQLLAFGAAIAATTALAALPACTSTSKTDDVAEDFAELAGAAPGGKADGFENMIVGSLAYGETSAPVRYRFPPRYRIFKFAADPGDVVDVAVTSQDGDAVAWVLDDTLVAIAFNDDADGSTFDAAIHLEIPAHPSRTHYIVFREYFHDRATFQVSLSGTPVVTDPSAIACGGFRGPGGVDCPAGYECRGAALAWDGTGRCFQRCGGFGGFMCDDASRSCIDDPNDDCDPATGGADCGGLCYTASTAGCDLLGCPGDGSSCVNCFGGWTCLPEGRVCAF